MKFDIVWFNQLVSTNASMRSELERNPGLPDGTVFAAREQTAGRGRQDRKWLAAPDANLCCSLLVRTDAPPAATPSLTMAAALAVDDLLRGYGVASAPKWPNDVLVGQRKICGILSERVEPAGQADAAIIVGIGLNINMTVHEAAAIDRPATSILVETGRGMQVDYVLAGLLRALDGWIGRWRSGGFAGIRSTWIERAGPPGRPLSVRDGKAIRHGTLAGFGEHGELLLQTEGGIESIWSGDVSG